VILADESHAVSLESEAKDAVRRSRRDENRQIFTILPSTPKTPLDRAVFISNLN
jgi:hypothetical protein